MRTRTSSYINVLWLWKEKHKKLLAVQEPCPQLYSNIHGDKPCLLQPLYRQDTSLTTKTLTVCLDQVFTLYNENNNNNNKIKLWISLFLVCIIQKETVRWFPSIATKFSEWWIPYCIYIRNWCPYTTIHRAMCAVMHNSATQIIGV